MYVIFECYCSKYPLKEVYFLFWHALLIGYIQAVYLVPIVFLIDYFGHNYVLLGYFAIWSN